MGSQSQILKTEVPGAVMMQEYVAALAKRHNGRFSTTNDGKEIILFSFLQEELAPFNFSQAKEKMKDVIVQFFILKTQSFVEKFIRPHHWEDVYMISLVEIRSAIT